MVFSLGVVVDGGGVDFGAHGGVLVGEVEEAAGDFDGEGLVAIEGEEPDAGVAVVVEDVGSYVEFVEPGEPWEGREEDGADALHEEGDDANPCAVGEGVEVEAFGEEWGDGGGVEVPVVEGEVVPALFHDREAGGGWLLGCHDGNLGEVKSYKLLVIGI